MPRSRVLTTSSAVHRLNIPGFQHLEYSEASFGDLLLPEAVRFGRDFGGCLQSLPEAAAFCVATETLNRQVTRTAAIHYIDSSDSKPYIAFDDGTEQNILLDNASRVREACKNVGFLRASMTRNQHILAALGRAEKTERIVEAPERNSLEFDLNGKYQNLVRGMLGDAASFYADLLQNMGDTVGTVHCLRREDIEKNCNRYSDALVLPMGIYGNGNVGAMLLGPIGVDAGTGGLARRVRRT